MDRDDIAISPCCGVRCRNVRDGFECPQCLRLWDEDDLEERAYKNRLARRRASGNKRPPCGRPAAPPVYGFSELD